MDKGEIILFQTQGGETKVEVRLADESVWLFGYTGADWDIEPEEAGTLMRMQVDDKWYRLRWSSG